MTDKKDSTAEGSTKLVEKYLKEVDDEEDSGMYDKNFSYFSLKVRKGKYFFM